MCNRRHHCALFLRCDSLAELELHCPGCAVFRVRAVPCCQRGLICHQAVSKLKCLISTQNTALNAQGRETPGESKLLLLLCLYQQICFSFPVPFSEVSSLPEDLDYNAAVPLKSLQLEAMEEQLVT